MNGHAKSFDETKCKLFLSKMNCLKNIAKSGKTAKKIFRKKKKTKKPRIWKKSIKMFEEDKQKLKK